MKEIKDMQKLKENMEKYNDPVMYDLLYEGYQKDFELIHSWALKQRGPVIDLACGTGRTALPLAKEGIKVIGIDLHEGMLARAQAKAEQQGLEIKWLMQDCTSFNVEQKSHCIYMTGNSFQHFLTNDAQNALLQTVYKHLTDKGVFIFGTRFPLLEDMLETEETLHYVDKLKRRVEESVEVTYDSLKQIYHSHSTRKLYNQESVYIGEEQDSISLRYTFPQELDHLLSRNRLRPLHLYGTWDREPLGAESKEIIVVCRKERF